MLLSYFKVIFRHLWKNRVFTIINITGLVIAITACLLILQDVGYELSFDHFFKNNTRLYRLQFNRIQQGKSMLQSARTNTAIGPTMLKEIPEVIGMSRGGIEECLIYYNDIKINDQRVFWVDKSFLKLFPIELIQGDADKALTEPFTTVLSEKQARVYFGSDNPLGKSVVLNEGLHFTVTGVFKDLPPNSHLKLDFLMSLSTGFDMGWASESGDWHADWVYTYILLQKDADPKLVEAKIPKLIKKYMPNLEETNTQYQFLLTPITAIHLDSHLDGEMEPGGDRTSVYALLLLALLILIMAWINFINLSTALSMNRSKEVGIRKTIGALKHQLVTQFLLESVIVNVMALVFSIAVVILVRHNFAQLTGKPLEFEYWWQTNLILWIAMIFVAGILLSGFYPAFMLSSFKPIMVLKGKMYGNRQRINLRRVLVIFQYAVSIALIAGALIIYRQISFMRHQQLGFDKEQMLVLYTPKTLNLDTTRSTWFRKFETMLSGYNDIVHVAASDVLPGEEIILRNESVKVMGRDVQNEVSFAVADVSYQFLDCFGLKLIAGRNFKEDYFSDRNAVLINEAALKQLGFNRPEAAINEQITIGNHNFSIIGVIHDYHHEGLQHSIEPMIFIHNYNYLFGYYTVKINTKNMPQVVKYIKSKWQELFPMAPFDYFFLDDFFNNQYQSDQRFGNIFTLFTSLAIVIACLGLFGLSTFTTLQRTKEIGIRKVMGANIIEIIWLISSDFAKWILLSFVMAFPVIYWSLHQWLQHFAYKIDIEWWVFVIAACLILFISALTVSYQTIKAANSNPVKALRYE